MRFEPHVIPHNSGSVKAGLRRYLHDARKRQFTDPTKEVSAIEMARNSDRLIHDGVRLALVALRARASSHPSLKRSNAPFFGALLSDSGLVLVSFIVFPFAGSLIGVGIFLFASREAPRIVQRLPQRIKGHFVPVGWKAHVHDLPILRAPAVPVMGRPNDARSPAARPAACAAASTFEGEPVQ